MTNMYVDGQTYRERFEIGDITEDNTNLRYATCISR